MWLVRVHTSQSLYHFVISINAGCISAQLKSLYTGFTSLIPASKLASFQPIELELLLSGPVHISVDFIEEHTKYTGYSSSSVHVKWLWKVVEGFSREERSMFLRFCTGSGALPIKGVESWQFRVQKGSEGTVGCLFTPLLFVYCLPVTSVVNYLPVCFAMPDRMFVYTLFTAY